LQQSFGQLACRTLALADVFGRRAGFFERPRDLR
jgi:hypothetical protein